jgi:hypothetical protein
VGVVEAPTTRPDGTILQVPGYDPQTRLLYAPNAKFAVVPDAPTQEDACKAYLELVDLYADFPHEDDERDRKTGRLLRAGAHKAVAIAHGMTIVGRGGYTGSSPFFLYDANIRASGKSLETDLAAIVASGRAMPRMGQPCDDTELEKVLGAYALSGALYFCLDNTTHPFGGRLRSSRAARAASSRLASTACS